MQYVAEGRQTVAPPQRIESTCTRIALISILLFHKPFFGSFYECCRPCPSSLKIHVRLPISSCPTVDVAELFVIVDELPSRDSGGSEFCCSWGSRHFDWREQCSSRFSMDPSDLDLLDRYRGSGTAAGTVIPLVNFCSIDAVEPGRCVSSATFCPHVKQFQMLARRLQIEVFCHQICWVCQPVDFMQGELCALQLLLKPQIPHI